MYPIATQKVCIMPRYAHAQFRWSESAQTYALSIDGQVSEQALTRDWLEQNDSFAFHSRGGMRYTARKQKGQRGSSYWYAYRRLRGRIVKRYLGKTADLTLARLEEVAQLLESEVAISHDASDLSQAAVISLSTSDDSPVEEQFHASPVDAYPLLLSKLTQPRLPAFLIERPRLFPLLDAGQQGPLTLLSAPAGFGKTTLVSQWLAARRASADFPPVAWISLEDSDNDALRFWRYLIAACQAFRVDLTQVHGAFAALTPQPPFLPADLSGLLTLLLNALAQAPAGGLLVLEDYHVITEHTIHETLSFFLSHLPATLHLFIITRVDPPFALASLRARHALLEVRTADLRFSQEETALLLHHSLPFPLDTAAVQHLHQQLEGWGAGLHLTRLALQRTPALTEDTPTIASFSQNSAASFHEYFLAEVFNLQPEPVQQFLLQTSQLPRLTASLCDAVTEGTQSQEMLTLLERTNLFIERFDSEPLLQPAGVRQWYRYHALFAEVMRHEARRRLGADNLQRISARASRWYEFHGFAHEAIEAALAAQDYTRTALLLTRFIEKHSIPGAVQEPKILLSWLKQLPEAYLEQHPSICLCYATILLLQNAVWQPDVPSILSIEKLLEMAEQYSRAEQQFSLLGEVFAFRALFALRQDQIQAAVTCARQALTWLAPTQETWRGLCATIAATEWIESGQFQQARAALGEACARLARTNNVLFHQVAMIKLAQVHSELGEIQQATLLYRQALEADSSTVDGNLVAPLANWRCTALLGYATLCFERNDLARASQLLQEALTLSQTYAFLHHEVHARLGFARLQLSQGQAVVAQQHIAELLEHTPASQSQLVRDIQIAQAHLALATNDHLTLQQWALQRTPRTHFTQKTEEDLLHARWLRLQGKEAEAYHQLESILRETREAGHTRRMLEVMVEMALSALVSKHRAEAQDMLREALFLALPNQPLRLFLDAGETVALLLRALLPQCHDPLLQAYIRTLLEAFPVGQQPASPALIEPLSPQELRVLHLLAEHRTNAEIAEALVVSINTVRTQVQSVYSKLGVHKRSAASDIARDLKLL